MSKKSISVPELQRLLRLKKGAAYYLVRQGYFETVTVGGKIAGTISASDVAAMLGIHRNKGLQRVSRDAIEKIDEQGVKFKFPVVFLCGSTVLVLKEPKTRIRTERSFCPVPQRRCLWRGRERSRN